MNQNTAGAVLLLILAAAGFMQELPSVWFLAGLSAALAFVRHDLDAAYSLYEWRELQIMSTVVAISSWVAVIAAALLLA